MGAPTVIRRAYGTGALTVFSRHSAPGLKIAIH